MPASPFIRRTAITALVLFAALVGAAPTPAKAQDAIAFQRVLIDTSGTTPEACFRFSRPLDPTAEAHYGDYLAFSPGLTPAVRADGRDLCVAGLDYGVTYDVTLRRGLPGADGSRLAADATMKVALADREPMVSIAGGGFVLPRRSANGLTIQTVNVDRVKIHVLRMSDSLLAANASDTVSYQNQADLSATSIEAYAVTNLLSKAATVVWSGTMQIERDHNRTVETAFPLAGIIRSDLPGAYLVIAENAASARPEKLFTPRAQDDDSPMWGVSFPAHWVIVTDIALTTLTDGHALRVQARSLASALPLPGIPVALLSLGQDRLGEAVTGPDGQASFPAGLLHGKGAAAPRAVAAYAAGGDFTLLNLDHPAFDFSDRGVSGREPSGALQAFVATDRGIYRPGETVNVTILLRDRVGVAGDGIPVTLILRRPDGVEARRFALAGDQAGGFEQPIVLTGSAARGGWTVEARVDPTGDPVGRASFEVQDFVPQQLAVTLKAGEAWLTPGKPIEAAFDGRFLYGAPADGLHTDAELWVMRDPAPVAAARDYQFGLVDEEVKETVQAIQLPDADKEGHVAIGARLDDLPKTSAPLKGVLTASMSEPSGRVVQDQVTLPIRNQKMLIGIRPQSAGGMTWFSDQNDTANDIRVFDAAGQPVAASRLHWAVVREQRVFDWFRAGERWTFHYHTVDSTIKQGEIDVPAGAPAVLHQPLGWGSYRLVVSDPASGAASSARFQVGWAQVAENPDTPDKIEVTAAATALTVGQTTHLHIVGPFAGQAEITIAGDRVFGARELAVPKEGADFDVTAAADWGPGAYVLVSMYRPLGQPGSGGSTHDPVRAVGVAWLPLDAAPHTLAVALQAPDKIVPRQTLRIPVHVTGGQPVFMTLAAVDEGILQLTRFKTPDPAAFLFGKRRLGVDMRDDYGRLLDGSAPAGAIREGGDGGEAGGAGLPVTSTRIVSLFSGPVTLDHDGNGVVTVEVPDFEGQLRLMALAWSHDAVGSTQASVTVRDPVIADPALPRFLAPGDSASLALLLANTDGAAGAYHLDLAADGPVKVSASHRLDWQLAAGERKQDAATIQGLGEGVATVRADLSGPNGYKVHREWQIAVRAPHQPVTLVQTAQQGPGVSFRLDPHQLDLFVPGSVTVSVGYAGFSGIDAPSLLQSLYTYPYGCTEQLSDSAWPLVYFNDPALLGHVPRDQGVKARVQQAIDTIIDREDAEGRFGLWRVGDGQASPWLDVFALDFLMHARDAGFNVPPNAVIRAVGWLEDALRSDTVFTEGYYAKAENQTRAYALYVLARAGRPDPGAMRRLHDTLSGGIGNTPRVAWGTGEGGAATPLALGQLAAALFLAGDHARAHDTFVRAEASLDGLPQATPSSWFLSAYWSFTRDLAGLVAVAADSGESALAQRLALRFHDLGLSAPDLTTQEKAALLSAAHALATDDAGSAVRAGNQTIAPLHMPAEFSPDIASVQAGYTIVNTGTKMLWRTLALHGVQREALPTIDQGYSLDREYLGLDGHTIDPDHLKQNDRFIVSLKGSASDSDEHRTVLVDLLPAGWEIEAPITSASSYDFLGPLSRVRVREARDDRFVAAFDLGEDLQRWRFQEVDDDKKKATLDASEFHLAYLVRVITPGRYTRPEAVVEDMYRPGVMARTDSGETVATAR